MPRMTGNHISINSTGGQYFFIDWQLAGQDVTNNYSAINWQAYFHYNSADAQLDNGIAGLSGTRWNNGGRVKNFEGRFVTRDVILASGSFNIGHNADGTQGISVSGGVDVYKSGRSAGSQWFGLPTIPRNSQVTTNDSGGWIIGTPLTIYTNRKSSSFTHTITIRLGGSGGTVLQTINSIGDSVAWTPSAEQIAQIQNSIPNDNRALIHITQYNNQVGQNSTTQAWNYIRDANPIFNNFTYKDSNTATAAITGNDQVLVKGKSTLQVTVPSGDKMVAQKGANPDYYAIAYDGVSNNLSYSTSNVNSSFTNIDTVGSRAILVTAYDSRTNNTRVAKNVQVYDYKAPNIEFEVTRENNFGEDVTIETGGTFDLLPINGTNRNAITASSLKYRYKEKGAATWGAYATIPFTVTDDGFAGTNQFISLDNTKEFEFEFQVADKFGTVNQATELGAGTPIMFAGRYSDGTSAVGINKVPENGVLDVDGDIYSNGVKIEASHILEKTATNWEMRYQMYSSNLPTGYIMAAQNVGSNGVNLTSRHCTYGQINWGAAATHIAHMVVLRTGWYEVMIGAFTLNNNARVSGVRTVALGKGHAAGSTNFNDFISQSLAIDAVPSGDRPAHVSRKIYAKKGERISVLVNTSGQEECNYKIQLVEWEGDVAASI